MKTHRVLVVGFSALLTVPISSLGVSYGCSPLRHVTGCKPRNPLRWGQSFYRRDVNRCCHHLTYELKQRCPHVRPVRQEHRGGDVPHSDVERVQLLERSKRLPLVQYLRHQHDYTVGVERPVLDEHAPVLGDHGENHGKHRTFRRNHPHAHEADQEGRAGVVQHRADAVEQMRSPVRAPQVPMLAGQRQVHGRLGETKLPQAHHQERQAENAAARGGEEGHDGKQRKEELRVHPRHLQSLWLHDGGQVSAEGHLRPEPDQYDGDPCHRADELLKLAICDVVGGGAPAQSPRPVHAHPLAQVVEGLLHQVRGGLRQLHSAQRGVAHRGGHGRVGEGDSRAARVIVVGHVEQRQGQRVQACRQEPARVRLVRGGARHAWDQQLCQERRAAKKLQPRHKAEVPRDVCIRPFLPQRNCHLVILYGHKHVVVLRHQGESDLHVVRSTVHQIHLRSLGDVHLEPESKTLDFAAR
mmetsp:Transcript_45022/g.86060  ORF Transcript_45022/g.86060 Transcript_45022/m.86060 type:complete len:468 (+) Transcript_45022:453-1856(+)